MVSRRGVLKILGGGVVSAAAAGTGAIFVAGQPSKAARAPWREAGQYDDVRKRALSYALLAPNPHNLQPWLVSLDGDDALTLYHDGERRLPVTDPFDRQITIGCGAFLELLSLAATHEGYQTEIIAFPDGEDMTALDARPVAHVQFVATQGHKDPLFDQILSRRTNKTVYEDREVEGEKLAILAKAGSVFGQTSKTIGESGVTRDLVELTFDAHVREVTTDAANRESVDLMRLGAKEVAANPDGIELEGPMITAGKWLGMINRDALADPTSSAFKQGVAMYEDMARSARAFGWISNSNESRIDQINAGRAYARMNLEATRLGLGIHPWSQALQEYEEMSDLYKKAHDLVGDGERAQMLYRIGYAKTIAPTPRRGLNAHLV
ncbi:MAG: twin-arginine translocation pathway signal protein [Pseudomonadota bacterium]